MPNPLSLPVSPTDRDHQCALLSEVLSPWPRQEDLANRLGVSRAAVSQWASGERRIELHVLRAALGCTVARTPALGGHLASAVVAHLVPRLPAGRWRAVGPVEAEPWPEESLDLVLFHGRLAEAVAAGDGARVEELAETAHHEVDQALSAARTACRRLA